jgi:hypothetical protein
MALQIAASNEELMPTEIKEEIKAFRTKDKIDQHTISFYKVFKDKDKIIRGKLIKSTRDGKDFTKGKQKELDKQKDENIFKRENNIFLRENQDKISIKRNGQTKVIQSRKCVAIEYIYSLPDTVEKGVVWLDEATGVPCKLETVPGKLPEIKKTRIHNAKVELDYTITPGGKWYLEKSMFKADIEAKILVFFTYKGKFSVESIFLNYKKL